MNSTIKWKKLEKVQIKCYNICCNLWRIETVNKQSIQLKLLGFREVHMFKVTFEEFLERLAMNIEASLEQTQEDKEVINKLLDGQKDPKELCIHARVRRIFIEDGFSNLTFDEEELTLCKESIEDYDDFSADSNVKALMEDYFDHIQEFFSLEPTERIKSRQIRAQIADIERLLRLEGFWIMGGIASYEAILEDQKRNEDSEAFEDGYGDDEVD